MKWLERKGVSSEHSRLVLEGAARLSEMANRVAGFAISASLIFIFACLENIAPWVRTRTLWFEGGIVAGNLLYILAVCFLYYHELNVRRPFLTDELRADLNHVSRLLLWSRIAGIGVFAAISMLAVWGTARGHG